MTDWSGLNAKLPIAKGAVSHSSDLLVVHIQRDGAPFGYHSNEVDLVQTPVDRRIG